MHLIQTTPPSLSLSANHHHIFVTTFPSPLSPVLGTLPANYFKKKLADHHRFQVTTSPIPPFSHPTTLPFYLPQLSTSTTPMITMVCSTATHTYLTNSYLLNKDYNSNSPANLPTNCIPTNCKLTHRHLLSQHFPFLRTLSQHLKSLGKHPQDSTSDSPFSHPFLTTMCDPLFSPQHCMLIFNQHSTHATNPPLHLLFCDPLFSPQHCMLIWCLSFLAGPKSNESTLIQCLQHLFLLSLYWIN
jgi:hypothetical protein